MRRLLRPATRRQRQASSTDGNGNSIVYIGATRHARRHGRRSGNAIDLASGVTERQRGRRGDALEFRRVPRPPSRRRSDPEHRAPVPISASPARPTSRSRCGLTASVGAGDVTVDPASARSRRHSLGTLIQDGSTLNVNGKTITFKNAPTPTAFVDRLRPQRQRRHRRQRQLDGLPAGRHDRRHAEGDRSCHRRSDRYARRRRCDGRRRLRPDRRRRSTPGALQISTGTTADLSIIGTGNALSALGLTGNTGTGTSFTAGRTAARWQPLRQDLDLHLLQRRCGGQRHLRRRLQRHGQDPRPAQCLAAGQQPDRDGRLDRQADDLHHQRLCFVDPRFGGGRWRDRRHADDARCTFTTASGSGGRRLGAGRSQQPGEPVQRHPDPDHHHLAGRVVQRRQPARRRSAQADVQRNRQVDA